MAASLLQDIPPIEQSDMQTVRKRRIDILTAYSGTVYIRPSRKRGFNARPGSRT